MTKDWKRSTHFAFYIVYLALLAVVTWFLLYYAGAPWWIYIFFIVPIVIAMIGAMLKAFFIKKRLVNGQIVNPRQSKGVSALYNVFHFVAILLFITGIVLAALYGSFPWWIWLVLIIGILFTIAGAMGRNYSRTKTGRGLSGLVYFIGVAAYIAFIFLLVYYSNSPWWVWLLVGIMILMCILAGGFDIYSEDNLVKTRSRSIPSCSDNISACKINSSNSSNSINYINSNKIIDEDEVSYEVKTLTILDDCGNKSCQQVLVPVPKVEKCPNNITTKSTIISGRELFVPNPDNTTSTKIYNSSSSLPVEVNNSIYNPSNTSSSNISSSNMYSSNTPTFTF